MTNEFHALLFCSSVCGAVSMTISTAKGFSGLRTWVKSKNEWIGEGLSCPYCTSHWVALILMLIYRPRPLDCGIYLIDFFTATMMMVALASITARAIFSAYAVMAPSPDETPKYKTRP